MRPGADRDTRQIPAAAVAAFVAAYLIAPGHPSVWFGGLPLDGPSLGVLVVVGVVLALIRPRRVERGQLSFLAAAAAALILVKAAIAMATPVGGWKAEYFANAVLQPPQRQSTDFPGFDGTRIDRELAFHDDTFPVFFFNENTFNRGIRREVSEPFSVRWTGYLPAASSGRVTLTARGSATLAIDGVKAIEITSARDPESASTAVTQAAGSTPRRVEVTYVKPPDTDGRLEMSIEDGQGRVFRGAPLVAAEASTSGTRSWTRIAAIGVHLAGLALFAFVLTPLRLREPVSHASPGISDRLLYSAMTVLFAAQGFWKAVPFRDRFVSLSSGDDWLQYEASAREILTGGLLMTYGKPPGQGDAYFYYPFYSYFLAFVHRLTGEDLYGIVVVQFLVLLLATILIHRLTRRLFGAEAALLAVGLLVAVEQMAFVRYYTVTLLAENLFFLTVAATVYALTRFVQTGHALSLVVAGLCGGVSAITKPSIMLMLPPAIVLVAIAGRRRRWSWSASAIHAFGFAAAWGAVVSLTLLRNYVVSGQPVLITTGQQWSFVLHNLPSTVNVTREYHDSMDNLGGGYTATVILLARLIWNYPADVLGTMAVKVGFSLGMVHWLGSKVHPELLLLTAGYLSSIVLFPAARQIATWPAHLFVATHLVTMVLTMPSIYGYRLILPMYLFFASFSGFAGSQLWSWVSSRWQGSGRAGMISAHGKSR
jgi:dolichyl-phosphate-mannose-protein mannosyltransferase